MYVACFSRPTVEMAAKCGFFTLFAPFAAAMMFGSVQAAARTYRDIAAKHGHTETLAMCSYFTHESFLALTDTWRHTGTWPRPRCARRTP
jgi:hypothetical protein